MPRRHKILIADQSSLFRDLESVFLARSGQVLCESDGAAALETARRERPSLAVLDLHLSGLSGEELCQALKTDPELRDTPIVMVVGGSDPEERERAVRAGADDVVVKPISRVTLIHSVKRLLRTRRPGLVRVPLETQVRMLLDSGEAWGTARNLSRGGMFVQADAPPPADTEIALSFRLPESSQEIAPTALVVWSRGRAERQAPGVGLQFLRLDRSGVERIDEYVYQYAGPQATPSQA